MSDGRISGMWRELQRRKVTRVALAYAVVSWAAVEVADTVFPRLGIPAWGPTLVIALVILGFPVALILGWAYDLTPQGVRRTDPEPVGSGAAWRDVQRVLTAALELPSAQRGAFLERACAGEDELLREVQSLLLAHERSSMLDRPAAELLMPHSAVRESQPSHGRRVANYQIMEKLGGGGMGVIYKARDLRLERIVALKFLPIHLSADERSKQRFLIEAQAAAALDHPNICTIHEIGETEDGHLYLAMPFYDGETLKQRIARGALPANDAVDVALQVSRGLAKAHERGIVHRDIKPANLMLTSEGVVKIVDFGIAKLNDASVTNPGAAPGTLAYMSPEQAQGEEVDGRTDLWSLGVVLYEMLTGERPFRGSYDGVLLNAILTTQPPAIAALSTGTPLALEQVVLRALAKRPEDRYRTALEMLHALEAVGGSNSHGPFPTGVSLAVSGAITGDASTASATDSGGSTAGAIFPDAERRQATIVTAALGGFDAMVELLVPQEVEEILTRLRAEASQLATRQGGCLNHLVGDELVLIFGIPAAQEDDAVRAIRAVIALRERVRQLNTQVQGRGAEPLRLHVGIDCGSVVARDGDSAERAYSIAGAPVQLATRLAAQAGPDEIWVTPECHHAISPFFDTTPQEPLTARGRDRPLVPHRVDGESGLQTRLEAAEKTGLTAYIGREAEVATLGRCLSEATQGEGQLVVIVGEAGMGKSRLIHEFRHRAGDGIPTVLLGRCQSYGSSISYLPFIEILRSGIGLGDGGPGTTAERAIQRIREIDADLEEFAPLYLHLLSIPSARHPVPKHLQGDAFRLAIQDSLASIITACAQREPTVVLLEDWHWADEASHAVLRGLAEVISGYPLLVVVTSRPGYGVEFGDPSLLTTVPLRPLEPSLSAAMLRSFLNVRHFPEELGSLLHERTGGNPFFLEEVCQALVEQGSIHVEDGEARLTDHLQMLDLPDSVQAVIRARLDRLDRHARDVLRLASVVGREFTHGILDLTVADSESLAPALEKLKVAGLIQQTRVGRLPVYRFKHILTQEVAYGSLLEHQRRDLHGRVGSAIEQLHDGQIEEHLDRLALHFSRAEAWEKAVRYGLRSADRTSELGQFAEALQILERTQRWLGRLPRGGERRTVHIQILLSQERLCETLGLRTRQQQIIDELVSLLDPARDADQLAEAYLRQGDLFTLLRRFAAAEEALRRSLEMRHGLGDPVGERNTLRSLGLLRWHEGRNEEALEFVQQTLRIDRQRQDMVGIVGDLTNQGAILRALGQHDRAQGVLDEALELSEGATAEHGGLEDELSIKRVYALHHLANIHRERGDHAAALACLHRAGEIAEAKRLPIQLSYHFTSVAHVYLLQGDTEQSLHYYREAVDLTRRAKYATGLAHSLRILGDVLLGLHRAEEAMPVLEEAAAVFAQLKDAENERLIWSRIAGAAEQREDFSEAIGAWTKAAWLCRQMSDPAGELEALEGIGRTQRLLSPEPALALAHYQRALELAGELRDTTSEGRLCNTLGILQWERGEYALALRQFERALALFREMGDPVHTGLMLNAVGATLAALRRLDDARLRLEEAVAQNRKTGQKQLEAHSLAVLGDVTAEQGDTAAATTCYQQSLAIRNETGDFRGAGWMLHNLARAHLNSGRADRASDMLDRAARIAHDHGDAELASACEQLRRIPV